MTGAKKKVRIAVLTSSRADYGIYLPLLKSIREDSSFELFIIAFGPHLSPLYGFTINNIIDDGFAVAYRLDYKQDGDGPLEIAGAMAKTSLLFADFWNLHKTEFDIVVCLGDRFEMFAAVIAGIPFNIRFAHIHGGETTAGAIDNVFRHSITLASDIHFVSCEEHARRVSQVKGSEENIYNTGSLSLENILTFKSLPIREFHRKYKADLSMPSILVTFHPETIEPEKNVIYADIISDTISRLRDYNIIITLPNADTFGSVIREKLVKLCAIHNNVHCFDNLGSSDYLTAMKYCSFLLGNSSSGIIEAASLGKWVINVGNRQKGRCQSGNIFNVSFDVEEILNAVNAIEKDPVFRGENIFYKKGSAAMICKIIKKLV